jgi:hypothetical protein
MDADEYHRHMTEATDATWQLLRYLARGHEHLPPHATWVRVGIPEGEPFTWDTLRALVGNDLAEREEDYMNIYARLTELGWKALTHA